MSSDRSAPSQTISNTFATNGSQAFAGTVHGDVHYGNTYITTVRPIARELHRSLLISSSDQFRPVQDDLARLMTILETITDDSFEIDCKNEPALGKLARDSHQTLNRLREMKAHYDSVGTQARIAWERQQWQAEELADIRSELTSTTSALNMVYIRLIRSSTKMVMAKLDTFIEEVRSGKREGSVVTNHTTESLSDDEKEAWRQLRKELESVGITPALFNQHHAAIIEKLQEAFRDGDLGIVPEEPPGNIEKLDTGDAMEFKILSLHAEKLKQNKLATANHTKPAPPKSQSQRTDVQSADEHQSLPIKGPSRVARSLSRITGAESKLRTAAELGNEFTVRSLPFNYGEGLSSLLSAAKDGHEEVVEQLLNTGLVDVNTMDMFGQTPLILAARGGHEAVVRLLLNRCEINVNGLSKKYPLLAAAKGGHEAVVDMLLHTGRFDINVRDTSSKTPLLLAAEAGHGEVVKLLLDKYKVDVNSRSLFEEETPLLLAAHSGHESVVKILLGTDRVQIDAKDRNNATPLWRAMQGGHKAVVKLLLSTGKVDVNVAPYPRKQTPLWLAAGMGHEDIVRLLLNTNTITVDAKDSQAVTPLSIAARSGFTAIVKVLLGTCRVDVNSRDKDWHTPLWVAANKGHKDVVELLLNTNKAEIPSLESMVGWRREVIKQVLLHSWKSS